MQSHAKSLNVTKRPSRAAKGFKGDLNSADCPSRGVLDHVTSRWGSLVLMVLLGETHRFSELRRRIGGVSEKMLAQSLKALEADGFVLRTVYATVPPQVEYRLTPLGEEVATHISGLTCWIEKNLPKVMAVRAQRDGVGGR
jgi:DNA-binding HxlR family transcriptional regulator